MEEQEYAGFWIRVGASIIDTVIVIIVFMVPLSIIYGSDYWAGGDLVRGFWDVMLSYVLPAVATIWFWLRYLGTPGKMLLRLRVVDAKTGEKITLGQSVLRYLGYFVSMITLMLGFVWIAFDKHKQGFHDKIAGTVVVRDLGKKPA